MRQENFRFVAITVALALVLAIGAGLIVFWAVRPASAKTKSGEDDPVMDVIPGRSNILVMGVDLREGDVGRSDAMVLVSIDSKGKPLLLSIPRDTRAKISGYGFDKINAAFAYGGPELSVETVSDLLGIPINDYLVVNIDAFTEIVDVLGGVTIDVEKRMYYEDPYQDLIIDLQPGVQRLDGEHAMQYVRFRHDETGDIGRIERQQHFLRAVAQEALSVKNLTKLPAFIRECYNAIDTNLSLAELLKLAATGAKAYQNGLNLEILPGEGDYVGNISYYIPDIAAMRQLIADRILTGIDVTSYLAQGERQADEYEASLLAEAEAAVTADKDDPSHDPNGSDGTEHSPGRSTGPDAGDELDPGDSGKPGEGAPDPGTTDPTTPRSGETPVEPPVVLGPQVEIFDASGYGLASEASQQLGAMGFRVLQAITSEQTQNVSTLIVYTQDQSIVAELSSLFPQARVIPGGSNTSGVAATIIIGKDAR